MSRLAVQQWVACLETTIDPPVGVNNFYNLLRVGHTHMFPGDTEFPTTIPRIDMFARFVNGTGVGEFEIRQWWLDSPEGRRRIETYGPFRVVFRPGEPLRDWVFRLLYLRLDGAGRYRLDLRMAKPRRRAPLASEYFYVVRLP
jgi:hypothetical protein